MLYAKSGRVEVLIIRLYLCICSLLSGNLHRDTPLLGDQLQ